MPKDVTTLAQTFVQQYEEAYEAGDYSKVDFYEGDEDWLDPDGLTADVLVKLRWAADYGMPAGDGWWSLVQFPDGSAVTLRGGDDASDPEVEDLPHDEQARAEAIANWCDIFGPLAALTLEPFDPNGTLTAEARSEWDDAISKAPSYITFSLDATQAKRVRSAFADTDKIYARAKAALAAPTTGDGSLLLGAIRFLEVGPNEYCSGQWQDLDT